MRLFRFWALSAAIVWSACTAEAALAADTVELGRAGPWDIRIDPTQGGSCFALRGFPGTSVVMRLAYDRDGRKNHLLLSSADWKSLESGKSYPLKIDFLGGSAHELTAMAQPIGDTVMLLFAGLSREFLIDFVSSSSMTITYKNSRLGTFPLEGSSNALMAIAACQKEAGFAGDDPFK